MPTRPSAPCASTSRTCINSSSTASPQRVRSTRMSAVLDRNAELTALHADIERKSMFPFWATNAGPGHDEVKRLMGAAPKAQAHLWSYDEATRPLLVKAAKLVTTVESERRSLIVVNPGGEPRRATVTTMYTAYLQNSQDGVM